MAGNELNSREEWKGHTGDFYDLDLLGKQNDLAKAIFELNKQTAVLPINGRSQSTNYLAEKPLPSLKAGIWGKDKAQRWQM